MKVEYSYYHHAPCMIVKGSDFLRAIKNEDEYNLLWVAVDGFCARLGSEAHFSNEVNDVIQQWLMKTGYVFYVIKEYYIGEKIIRAWCEVYVRNGEQEIEIIISRDNGRNFALNHKEEKTD